MTIEETVTDEYTVEAMSEEDAIEIARRRYRDGEYVLEPGNVENVRLSVAGIDGEYDSWVDL